jgi:hypothetical protein
MKAQFLTVWPGCTRFTCSSTFCALLASSSSFFSLVSSSFSLMLRLFSVIVPKRRVIHRMRRLRVWRLEANMRQEAASLALLV